MPTPRRARRLVRLWRTERRTFRQALVALALSTAASFVAGLTLGSISGTLSALPGLLVLIPAAVGMRGTIFGAIGARLGTGVAAGTFQPSFDRDGLLGRNLSVAVLTTLTSSLWLALLAKVATAAFHETSISLVDFVTISVVGGVLGSVVILAATVGLALVSSRRGYDLDSVGTPLVTALGDMVTLPTLFLATLLIRDDTVNAVVATLCVLAALGAFVRIATTDVAAVRRIVLHMTPVIVLTPVLDIAAGAALQTREPALTAIPVLLVLIPPFVSQAGALGGILSSRLSSKLQLGVIAPRSVPQAPAVVDGAVVTVLGLTVFAVIGIVASMLDGLLPGLEGGPSAPVLVGGTVLAGALVMPVLLGIGYAVAVLTSRFDLDPDDHAVPIITSVMDLTGVVVILASMSLIGVGLGRT